MAKQQSEPIGHWLTLLDGAYCNALLLAH